MGARFRGKAHVLRHAAVHVALEAVYVVAFAHPVFAAAAVAALLARDNLFRDQSVAELVASLARGVLADLDGAADELVAGDHRRLDVARLAAAIAPERRSAFERLDVAGADAAGLDFDDDVVGPGARHVHRLQAVVAGGVGNHRRHRGRQRIGA